MSFFVPEKEEWWNKEEAVSTAKVCRGAKNTVMQEGVRMCLENNTAMIGTAWFLEQRLKQEKIPCDLQPAFKQVTRRDSELCQMAADLLWGYSQSSQRAEFEELFCGLTGWKVSAFLEHWIRTQLFELQRDKKVPVEICLADMHFLLAGKCEEEEVRLLFPFYKRAKKQTVFWKPGEAGERYLQNAFVCKENLRLYLGTEKGLVPGGMERRKRYAGKYPMARQPA